jgi:hypothetical protein
MVRGSRTIIVLATIAALAACTGRSPAENDHRATPGNAATPATSARPQASPTSGASAVGGAAIPPSASPSPTALSRSDTGIALPLGSPQTVTWSGSTVSQVLPLAGGGRMAPPLGSDSALGQYVRFTGSSWGHVGPGLWDQTQPITLTYKARFTANGPIAWTGSSVLYSSEGSYQSGLVTDNGAGKGAPYAWPFQASTYRGQIGTTVGNGSVVTVRQTWSPATGTFTVAVDGHSRTDAARATTPQDLGGHPVAFPYTLWWGKGVDSSGVHLDIGPMTITGNRLWGAADDYGWNDWTKSANVTLQSAPDTYWENLCSAPYDCPVLLGGLTASGSWTARSPVVGFPAGHKLAQLRLFTQGNVQVFVRYADGSKAFDGADVNRLGSLTHGVRWTMNGTRIVDLSRLAPGRAVYLDVRGAAGSRLAGAWISFGR